MSEHTVGVVADDLTGAGDCVVQFARAGWTSHLALGPDLPSAERAAVAVVTDARAQDDAPAAAATAAAVRALADAGRLYVKIDSTMRGSVAAQVTGALTAWRERVPGAFAVVCPSYPALGRTVGEGVLLVGGVPVAATAAGHDPVTPVRTSDLTALLPGALRVPADGEAAALADRLAEAGAAGDVVVADALDDAGLARLADAVVLLGARAVPVGSGGLAAALAPRWGGDRTAPDQPRVAVGRTLVVLSSLNEVSRGQAEELLRSEPGTLLVTPEARTGPAEAAARALGRDLPATVLVRTPEPTGPAGTGRERATRAAAELADLVAAVTEQTRPDAIVLIGGDGARAVLARLGARSVRVAGSVAEGVPLGRLEGGAAHGTVVVTKAGGFGTRRTVVDVLESLRSYSSHQEVNP